MRKLLILLLCLWVQAQESKINKLIENINPEGFTGFYLYDSARHTVLEDFQSDKLFIPASNAKIFTFDVVYKALGDSIPTANYAYINDSLFIKPLGDPTFFYSSHSSDKLLNLLNHKGIIAIDFSFNESAHAPGWSIDDIDQSYMPERSILPMYGNLMSENSEAFFEFDSLVSNRKLHENVFNNSTNFEAPFIVSDSLILHLLKLDSRNNTIITKAFPKNENFTTLYSSPKKPVLRDMMLDSDNFLAEQLTIMVKQNPELTVGENWEHYFEAQCNPKPRLEDGSGLSRYDLVSPKCIAHSLLSIQKTIPDYLSYFPENGVSGTLEKSYLQEPNYIYAKTGSMSGVYNVSGYLKTDSGKLLIFSLMNNNFTEKGKNLKPRIEELLLYIKHHY